MRESYYVPKGRSVGMPSGGIYTSGCDVPAEHIKAFGPKKVAHMVKLGRLAILKNRPELVERTGRTGRVSPSKWTRDPDSLEGMSLDELNVMILEIDENVDLFETELEAVSWLSQDYEQSVEATSLGNPAPIRR